MFKFSIKNTKITTVDLVWMNKTDDAIYFLTIQMKCLLPSVSGSVDMHFTFFAKEFGIYLSNVGWITTLK